MGEWKTGDKKMVEVRCFLTRIKSVISELHCLYGSEAFSPGSSVLGPYYKLLFGCYIWLSGHILRISKPHILPILTEESHNPGTCAPPDA